MSGQGELYFDASFPGCLGMELRADLFCLIFGFPYFPGSFATHLISPHPKSPGMNYPFRDQQPTCTPNPTELGTAEASSQPGACPGSWSCSRVAREQSQLEE